MSVVITFFQAPARRNIPDRRALRRIRNACPAPQPSSTRPITSWGVLLTEAQNINVVALYPWLMLPVVPVILVVLAFNFFGDGLRDAADPYT